MAESKRKNVGSNKVLDDAAQSRKDRLTLIIMAVGSIVLIAGMILISKFISGN